MKRTTKIYTALLYVTSALAIINVALLIYELYVIAMVVTSVIVILPLLGRHVVREDSFT